MVPAPDDSDESTRSRVTDNATSQGRLVPGMTETARTDDARPVSLADEAAVDAFVADNSLALIQLSTEGCSICASMEPVLTGVARTTRAAVGVCYPRDDPALIDRFDVRSVPTLLLFRDGDRVARRADGFVGVEPLREWIAEHASAGHEH